MLTYCLNIHRGETWAENFATLRTTVLAVRNLVSPGLPFGLGMRLSAAAANEMDVAELRAFLESENLFVFTINGFPYGRFHGGAVKENVYAPDWRSPLRRDYTNRLADILSALTAGTGTISTVPCSWKAWNPEIAPMLDHLTDCVAHFATSTKNIVLTVEPEPGCLLETTAETIAFFADHLFQQGAAMLAAKLGVSESDARELMRHHLGVCLDTCHAALQFEDPFECLRRYEAAGIRVPKIQISSALRTDISSIDALRPFVEPVYLHQVKARTATGEILSWTDLPQALAELPATKAREVRVHFHVPLHYPGDGPLQSTGALLSPEFLRHISRDPANHLEIETYTWDVLPPALRSSAIEESIAAEFRWVRESQ